MLGRMNERRTALSRSRFRVSAVVAIALVASLAIAGCGSESKSSSDEPDSQPTQGGTKLAAVWPLTGLPAPETTPNHPVMIVKIDNTYASEPQVGLGKA